MNITAKVHDCSIDGETGYAAVCAEFPEANGQGDTIEECLDDLRTSVAEILAFRRDQATQSLSAGDRLEVFAA